MTTKSCTDSDYLEHTLMMCLTKESTSPSKFGKSLRVTAVQYHWRSIEIEISLDAEKHTPEPHKDLTAPLALV